MIAKRDEEDADARAFSSLYTSAPNRYRTSLIDCPLLDFRGGTRKETGLAANVCLAAAPPRVRIIERSLKSLNLRVQAELPHYCRWAGSRSRDRKGRRISVLILRCTIQFLPHPEIMYNTT